MGEVEAPTDFLFARPSFVEGIARILDFGDTLTEYNRSEQADALALRADWRAVATELRRAAAKYLAQLDQQQLTLDL